MKQLFLTSEINLVAQDIVSRIKTVSGGLKTAYITTPIEKGCEGDLSWHIENQNSMKEAGFVCFNYSITGKNKIDIERDLTDVDVIYVEGGSLVHMMNQVRKSGFDNFIHKFIDNGGVYIGTSTGSFIAAPDTTAGLPLEDYLEEGFVSKGMGLVNFLIMPHWGTEDFREKYKDVPIKAYNTDTPMIILTDKQYVWVNSEEIRIIAL